MIGTTIGKYRIVGLLGRGATGIVYRAVDGSLQREVAIKVLNPHVAAADIMKRFRAEAAILAKLSHPQIATIHELLQTNTDQLMVMELVRGETLEKLSNRVGPLAPDIAARLIDAILSALEHAHRNGIVHRDLKPANIMVTELGGIKIMDFGISGTCLEAPAKAFQDDSSERRCVGRHRYSRTTPHLASYQPGRRIHRPPRRRTHCRKAAQSAQATHRPRSWAVAARP